MLFDNWEDIFRPLIVGSSAYAALLIMLRISGKRTLTSMSAFDLVVSVALGSTLASILMSDDVSLVQGLVSFLTLIGLQFVIEWLSVRSRGVQEQVRATPQLLFYRGNFMEREMRRERVTRDDIYAAIRSQGRADLDDIEAVVLESNGNFSVLERTATVRQSSLINVAGEGNRRGVTRR